MLFYNMEGTIQRVKDMVITPVDIFLRDIGTKGHTDFVYDEECMDFVERNNLHMTKYGFIHSHNSMQVFFSPEDKDELQDNVGNHNIYLSLIVNNFMDMTAKVVSLAQPSTTLECVDEDGNRYDMPVREIEKVIMEYNCSIEMPKTEFDVNDDFKNVLNLLKKRTADKARAAQHAANNNNVNRGIQQHASGGNGYNSWGKSEGYQQDFK